MKNKHMHMFACRFIIHLNLTTVIIWLWICCISLLLQKWNKSHPPSSNITNISSRMDIDDDSEEGGGYRGRIDFAALWKSGKILYRETRNSPTQIFVSGPSISGPCARHGKFNKDTRSRARKICQYEIVFHIYLLNELWRKTRYDFILPPPNPLPSPLSASSMFLGFKTTLFTFSNIGVVAKQYFTLYLITRIRPICMWVYLYMYKNVCIYYKDNIPLHMYVNVDIRTEIGSSLIWSDT